MVEKQVNGANRSIEICVSVSKRPKTEQKDGTLKLITCEQVYLIKKVRFLLI